MLPVDIAARSVVKVLAGIVEVEAASRLSVGAGVLEALVEEGDILLDVAGTVGFIAGALFGAA
jgi:hypothetical protein